MSGNFFQSLNDREKIIYNQGVLDNDKGMRKFKAMLKKQSAIEKQLLNFLQYQNLCAPCKRWLKEFAEGR
jgi:hypothetical protein